MRVHALAFCLFVAASAGAQPRSADLFVLGGLGRVAGDEGSLGTGPALAGALQAPFTRRLALDFDVAWTSASRDFGGGSRSERDQTLVSPSLVYRWGSERTYAFLGGGVGLESRQRQDVSATLNFKAGFVTRVSERLLFRFDFLSATRHALPHLQVRAGLGFRF